MIVTADNSSFEKVNKGVVISRMSNNYLNETVLTKFMFSRRCISGKAKLSIQSESKLNSCDKLRELLFSEYGLACN